MNALPRDNVSCLSERAQAQTERILLAARQCFIEHGFHAAGMARIAETAGMSPGLIYRYFASKDAIILAIVERQLEEARDSIRGLYNAEDFGEAVLQVLDQCCGQQPGAIQTTLFLEMSAAATRDPQLAEALQQSDRIIREELAGWLATPVAQGGKALPIELARERALSLQCFVEGLAVRALREPGIPRATLRAAIEHFTAGLFVR